MENKVIDIDINQDNSKKTYKNTTIIYLILLVCFIGVRILASYGFFSIFGDYADIVSTVLIQIIIMFGISVVLFKVLEKKSFKQTFKEFRFNKISGKAVGISIAIGVVVFVLNIAVSSFFSSIIHLLGYEPIKGSSTGDYSILAFIIQVITVAILPGICEETAHRGLLLKGYEKLGMKKAILISGLLFGLMHLNIEQFFYASIIGFFLGFIGISAGSIIPCIIIHFMNNFLSTYTTFAQHNNWFMGDFINGIQSLTMSGSYFASMLIIFTCIILAIFLLFWLVFLLLKQTAFKRIEKLGEELQAEFQEQPQMFNMQTMQIKLPPNFFGVDVKQTYFPTLKENAWLYTTLFLGVLITIFTFIWGVL